MTDSTPKSSQTPSNHESTETRQPALLERCYRQESSSPDFIAWACLVVAGLSLGAVSYGYFFVPTSEYQTTLVVVFFVAQGIALYRGFANQTKILVGDAGVAIEQTTEQNRLLWWEIKSVRYETESLVLVGETTSLRIPSQVHTRAIRAILAEAAERLPNILDVPSKIANELPTLKDAPQPPAKRVESLQIAGKRCASTRQVITVERDARLCPQCASVYHRNNLPQVCVTCHRELGKNAVAL
jgi:hypothetical protein